MEEIWKDVIGYEGVYSVSNIGRVKSLEKTILCKGWKIVKEKVLRLKLRGGYMAVGLYKNKKQKYYYVHRLVANAFIENTHNKPQINHIDANKTNNNLLNIEWVTQSENRLHAQRMGLCINCNMLSSERMKKKTGKDNHASMPIIDTQTGVKYSSIREAAKKVNINYNTLYGWVNNIYPNKSSLRLL